MSLLQSVAPEIIPTQETVFLANIPSAEALAIDRSVHTFGPSIQEELGIEPAVVEMAEEESKALTRDAIRHSFTGNGARNGTLAVFNPNETIDSRVDFALEDREMYDVQPESAHVHVSTLKYMAYCLLRQGARSKDKTLEKEAVSTIEWLEANEAAKPVINEVLHPARSDVIRAVGRIANKRRMVARHRLA